MLYASIIVASIDIRRASAEASVSGLPDLLFGADVGNRPPEDAVEARGGLVALGLRAPAPRTAPTRSAPSRCENESSSIRRSVLPRGAGGSLQARRQDIVDGSSRLHSTRGSWYGRKRGCARARDTQPKFDTNLTQNLTRGVLVRTSLLASRRTVRHGTLCVWCARQRTWAPQAPRRKFWPLLAEDGVILTRVLQLRSRRQRLPPLTRSRRSDCARGCETKLIALCRTRDPGIQKRRRKKISRTPSGRVSSAPGTPYIPPGRMPRIEIPE